MVHFTFMVNPNKSSLSNQIPKIKVAELPPVGSGPRYMMCVTLFCTLRESENTRACENCTRFKSDYSATSGRCLRAPRCHLRSPSVCKVNNSNSNFSPKKVPTYSQLGKYYYGCNSGCVSFLSSVRREANPDPNASAMGCLQRTCLWALKAPVRRPPSWWPHGTAFQQFRCLIIHITRKGFGVRHHLLKYGCSIA